MIKDLFGLEMATTHTNKEDPTEVTHMSEDVFKLTCQIENGNNSANTLQEGLKLNLEGDIEKNSPNLGRDAVWSKVTKVNRLPKYVIVNFMRFYWKEANAASGTEAGKAKILRQVTFPKVFDMFEFCTDELKSSLIQGRDMETKNRADEDEVRLGGKTEEEKKAEEAKGAADVEMADEEEKKDGDTKEEREKK